ncbi:MAG: GspE/PulE family protein [Bacilli bacterium]
MVRTFDYEKLPIVEIVNEIILDAVRRGASDIHFDPQEEYMKVRIRVDGQLGDYTTVPNTLKKNLITRIKIISGMNITEVRLPQDGSLQTVLKNINLDLRVSSLPCTNGEKIVIRILDYSMSLQGLEHLGFTENNYHKMLEMIDKPSGIILVTGATGSGKSTTVYSLLQRLNRESTNVITVEDPIEMSLEGVNQVQVNSDIGLTFANVLRSILRQDPNIIMVGEIRDNETARIAVRASITGHLVLSTIHTNNSLNTIERLLDMEVERYLLASALEGIVSQKLARRLCEKCRRLRPTNQYEKNLIKNVLGADVNEIYSAEGCDECNNGYKGRIAIHEVLLINQDIRDALANGVSKEGLREMVYKSNVTTLLQDGLEKVVKGTTTCEEVLKLIELDDDLEGKTQEYRYSLNRALEESNLQKSFNDKDKDKGKEKQNIFEEATTTEEKPASVEEAETL